MIIARRLCGNPWCALIAPALLAVAPWFVLYGRMLWPQSLFPGLVPLIWLSVTALLDRPSWPRGLALGLCLGIGLQLHLSMLALAGLVVIITVAATPARLRCLAAVGLGAIVGYAPLVVHDVVNGFQTVSTLLALPAVHVAREPWLTHAAKAFWNFSNTLSGQALWVSKLGPPSPLPAFIDWAQGLVLTTALGGASWLLLRELAARDGRPWASRWRSPHARLLVLTWVPVLYLAVSSTQITRHYFLVLFPLPFILVAVAADRLLPLRPGLRPGQLAVALLAVVALNLATVGYLFAWLDRTGGAGAYGPRLSDRSGAVSFIRDDSGGAFGADVRSTREPLPYVFLFQRTAGVTVDATDQEHVGRIESAVGDRPRRLYKIVEPEYFPSAVSADATVWRSASVVVERLQ